MFEVIVVTALIKIFLTGNDVKFTFLNPFNYQFIVIFKEKISIIFSFVVSNLLFEFE